MKDKQQDKAFEAENIEGLEKLKNHLESSIDFMNKFQEDFNETSWGYEKGVLISGNDAKLVLQHIFQSRQPKPAKSLQECKDEVARKYKYENWKALSSGFKSYHGLQFVENRFNEAAELYASQREEQAVKVALEMAADKGEGEITICNEHAYLYCAKIDKQSILSLAPQVLEKLKEERK